MEKDISMAWEYQKLQNVDVMGSTGCVCQPGCPLQDLVLLLEKQVYVLEKRCIRQEKEIEMLVAEAEVKHCDTSKFVVHTINPLTGCSEPSGQTVKFEIKEEYISDDEEPSNPVPSSFSGIIVSEALLIPSSDDSHQEPHTNHTTAEDTSILSMELNDPSSTLEPNVPCATWESSGPSPTSEPKDPSATLEPNGPSPTLEPNDPSGTLELNVPSATLGPNGPSPTSEPWDQSPTLETSDPPVCTHQCPNTGCNYGTNDKYYLNRHMRRRHGAALSGRAPFACPHADCAYETPTLGALRDHRARVHETARPFACSHKGCQSRYAVEGDLKAHVKNSHTTNPRLCPYEGCYYRSGNPSNLSQHVRRHAELQEQGLERVCQHAGCRFRARSDAHLRRHVALLHSGARRYTCTLDGCGFVCATRKDLSRHLMTRQHNPEKPVECPVVDCKYGAAIRRYVTDHVRRCHGEEHLLSCDRPACGYRALNREEMKGHMKLKHATHGVVLADGTPRVVVVVSAEDAVDVPGGDGDEDVGVHSIE